MKTNRAIILSLVATLLFAMSGFAATVTDVESAKAEARLRLSRANTPADSIMPLYDLYDLSNRAERPGLGFTLHDVAMRAGDDATRLDILRQLTVYYGSADSILRRINAMIKEVPESADQRESLTFNNIYINARSTDVVDEQQRIDMLRRAIKEYADSRDDDIYSRIERLFTLCNYLADETRGDLLASYYHKLDDLINQLPPSASTALRNQFYTFAAIAYTDNGNSAEAVKADLCQLQVIEDLKKRYAAMGRQYRNYYTSEYVIYRRLLANYEALTPEQVEEYYDKAVAISRLDSDIAADIADNHRIDIYYLMANGQYDEALPMMLEQLPAAKGLSYRMKLMRSIITAAKAVGDLKTKSEIAIQYVHLLEEYIENKAAERYRELQIIYDTQELKSRNAKLELEQAAAKEARNNLIIAIALVSIVALSTMLIWSLRLYRHSRRLTESLTESNEALRSERAKLRRTHENLVAARDEARETLRRQNDLVNNLSHDALAPLNAITEYSLMVADSADEAKGPYIGRFADSITHNVDLLQGLFNNMLELGSIDNSKVVLDCAPVDVAALCIRALDTVSHEVGDGVSLVCDRAALPADVINTDAKRVERILVNLLDNAIKFTEHGSVTLKATTADGIVSFIVEDTGIGIPPEQQKLAFDRFEKLGRPSRGIGLGLSLSRSIARLLGGDVIIDAGYAGPGTRVIFTLPMHTGA